MGRKMEITVVGTGYVGLVVGAGLAEAGNHVVCCDIDADKIGALNAGRIPIYEPGLDTLVQRNHTEGRLRFSSDVDMSVSRGEIIFIAVGTPPEEDGSADLKHVLNVAERIGRNMLSTGPERIIVTKSTVPVGTAPQVRRTIGNLTHRAFHVCSNPEFLREGMAVKDFMYPDRVVIGADSEYAKETLGRLYEPFVRDRSQILFMDIASAEITKYAANAMLATRISFMNMIAGLCEKADADIQSVRQGLASDSRIGPAFLNAGLGYGGSCFPKDVKALIHTLHSAELDASILEGVERVNERQKLSIVARVTNRYGRDLSGLTFAVWGLSFKPETDDMREAASLDIIRSLCDAGAHVVAHDPQARKEASRYFADLVASGSLSLSENHYTALDDADALLVLTEWRLYQNADVDRIRRTLRDPVIFDGRNLWNPANMIEKGFSYYPTGKPHTPPLRIPALSSAAGD